MKYYYIRRTDEGVQVEANVESDDSIHAYPLVCVSRHSTTGFDFGCDMASCNNGALDLARCILIDMGYQEVQVDLFYHDFKHGIIGKLSREEKEIILYGDIIQFWWDARYGRTNT